VKDLPTECPECGAQAVEYKGIASVLTWTASEDGHKMYAGRCTSCRATFDVKGPRIGPADGGPWPSNGFEATLHPPLPPPGLVIGCPGRKARPARALDMTIAVPIETWLGASAETRPLLRLLGAAKGADGWFQDVYPPDSFDGSSGDPGAVRVTEIRDDLFDALSDVRAAMMPVQIIVRGSRSCSESCPWWRRLQSPGFKNEEDECTLFGKRLGFRAATPTPRCQQCVGSPIVRKGKA
jgi:hypothetical protein